MRLVAFLAAAWVALAWPVAGLAQQAEAAAAAGQGADAPLPVTAFTSPSQLRSARLSPDGTRLAYLTQQDGKTFIIVRDAGTLASVDGGNLGEDVDVNWFRWTGNNGLLLSLMGKASSISELVRFFSESPLDGLAGDGGKAGTSDGATPKP